MKQALFTESGFVVEETAIPECGRQQVLVKSRSCGICSGDLHLYKEGVGRGERVRLGHEGSGVVAKVGDLVNRFQPGDRVTSLGGAYAEFFVASPDELVKVPEDVDLRWALGEPLACCVHAVRRSRISSQDRVAVVGCGFMGLTCLQLSRIYGAEEVVAVDLLPWRLEVARSLGAAGAYIPDRMPLSQDPLQTGEFEVVIEAAGAQQALDLCGDLVAQHGRLNLVGYHQSRAGMRYVNIKQWNFKAIEVVNGHVRRMAEKLAAMGEGIELLQAGTLDVRPLVSYYELDDIDHAFQELAAGKQGLFKGVILF